jgi:hypothetical protein
MIKKEIKRLKSLLEINKKGLIVTKTKIKDSDRNIIRELHGSHLIPDDFRYATLNSLLNQLIDYDIDSLDKLENQRGEIVDSLVDIYTIDLLEWLASSLDRLDYVECAKVDNCSPNSSVLDMITMGQYLEIDEIMSNITSHLESLEENSEVA